MECPTVLINDMKFYEVQKYMVLDGHLYNPIFIFINEQFFQDKLTPAQQKVVADAAKVLAVVHNGFSQQSNIEGLENLKAMGMEVVTPTEKSLKQFREISQPVALDYIKEKAGDVWVEKALKAAKLSEEVVGSRSEQIVKDHIKLANDKYQQIGK
jgi:C4-dicarboxylate-binding protein DctP